MVEYDAVALDVLFHALADETRRALLREVAGGSRTVGELALPHAMSLAGVSKHLLVLERASLVRRERRGTNIVVSLNPEPLRAAQQWIAFYEHFWTASLDRLQTQLEKEADTPCSTRRKA